MLHHNSEVSPQRQLGGRPALEKTGSGSAPRVSAQSIRFLKQMDPSGWHNLVMIQLAGKIDGRTFAPGSWDAMAQWIDERDGKGNLYFSVNEPKAGAAHTKLDKEAIANVRAIYYDADPQNKDPKEFDAARERARTNAESLKGSPIHPSALVDSGGGYQGFLFLKNKIPVADEADWTPIEDQVRGIAAAVDGDTSVADLCHLMRLPGTMNLPNAKKRGEGRSPRRGRLIDLNDRRYGLKDIAKRFPPVPKGGAGTKSDGAEIVEMQGMVDIQYVTGAASYDDLDTELRAKFQHALDHDEELRNLWATGETGKPDKSASARRFALAAQMKAWRFSINDLGALLWVWGHSINPDEDPSDKITDREISRVWVNSPHLPPKEAAWLDDLGDPPEEGSTSGRGERQPLKLVSFQEVAGRDLSAAPAPLVKGLLTHGGFSVLYGESNTGKTFIAMDLAFHISAGAPWDGMKVSAVPVIYVAAEGSYGVELRVKALQRKFPEEAAGAKFDLVLSGVDLFRRDADLTRLIEAVRSQGARFVVLDTLSRVLAGGDENSSTDMGALVRNIDALRQATGAHVMAVHHSGKNRDRGARGHSLLRAAIDTEIEIADDTITVTKQRDLDRSYNRAFILEPVTLHMDEDGEPISSCTVRLVSKADLPPGDVTETERQIVEAMAALERENDRTAHTTKEITAYLDSEGDIRGEIGRAHV